MHLFCFLQQSFFKLPKRTLAFFLSRGSNTSVTDDKNKELFKNAPPYMIIRPSLKGGLYMSAGQTSKWIVKITYIHVQLLTKPHEYYDKSVYYSFASYHKSIWIWWQIWMTLVTNTHKDYSKLTGKSWQLWMTLVTNTHEDDSKSTWILWQILMI